MEIICGRHPVPAADDRTIHTHTTILRPSFQDYQGEPGKRTSGLHCARKDNRQTHWKSSWVSHHPDWSTTYLRHPPIFTPDALPVTTLPNLSWLGTGTKYAGLHTQWLDLTIHAIKTSVWKWKHYQSFDTVGWVPKSIQSVKICSNLISFVGLGCIWSNSFKKICQAQTDRSHGTSSCHTQHLMTCRN